MFRQMAISLDDVDMRLLEELERDADRANVELARIVGLSPAATLKRIRRLKDEGVIKGIRARLDTTAVGFPLQVYIACTLGEHDERANQRFEAVCAKAPNVVRGDWVTGETDALLQVVARDVAELQRVLMLLSTRGGASRLMTFLRLEEFKAPSPLPRTRVGR
ncbi:MAG: Lrp/AsnC family transcriptional regulator, leucine-responsive regulatory protein [Thermoleophilaceae bacterium]|jgi:Lrp/AsnC family leucine-responsive transcriptional regulator|nr:Lrp/AsnC family transcriptional regulator, leucine-responsive regulatory protein [Thermoleophilaceae bacterium]